MFALEITFSDGVSQPEMILVRRPQALIGASDTANVVMEDMSSYGFQLKLVKGLGRKFSCRAVTDGVLPPELTLIGGNYDGEGTVELPNLTLHITALDSDLAVKEQEPPDRAGVRILRQATSHSSPVFPCVVVTGSVPVSLSFAPDQPIYIGRAKSCNLRLDSADISSKHARLGYESGEFWIEDLGSTNGTYVNQQQISGRASVKPGVPVVLGRETSIVGISSMEQFDQFSNKKGDAANKLAVSKARYPVLVSISEVARPARLVLQPGVSVSLGRDPASEMWLGAPHISRRHCSITLGRTGSLSVTDTSTNGTAYEGGILRKGEILELKDKPMVLDFGGGVTVAVCHSEKHEGAFNNSGGSVWAFSPVQPGQEAEALSSNKRIGALFSSKGTAKGSGLFAPIAAFGQFFRGLSPLVKICVTVVLLILGVILGVLLSLLLGK